MRTITVKNWRHVQELAARMILWGFRGQEDASWELDTTLHRTASEFNHPFDMLWHREYWMLRQFQRRAHNYSKDLPDFDKKLDWLALMQHYGAPTRLLDFSHSFYVAAYFALENAKGDSAVWAVNLHALTENTAMHCEVGTEHENIDTTNQRHIEFVNEHISIDGKETTKNMQLIVHVEPEQLHERLLTQQGFFLFPCDIEKSFKDNLETTLNSNSTSINENDELIWDGQDIKSLEIMKHPLIKLILPKEIRYDAITSLNNMNITAATLFPGLDGFAKSMKYHLSTWPGNK